MVQAGKGITEMLLGSEDLGHRIPDAKAAKISRRSRRGIQNFYLFFLRPSRVLRVLRVRMSEPKDESIGCRAARLPPGGEGTEKRNHQ
jgi:hypothetical protein